jgi:tetratricopeptide (TPR) repeat protein
MRAAGDTETLVKISNSVPPELTRTLLHRAGERAREGDADGAVADFRRASRFHPEVARDPAYAAALRARTETRLREGRTAEALEDLDEMVRIDPAAALPAALAPALVVRAARRTGEAAVADLDRAIAIDPKLASAWEARGLVKESRMDYADAREDLKKALELDPNRKSQLQPLIAKLDDLLR